MSALLISSAAFASGDPQTFPSSRGTIRYGDDVYISANDTNTLNQMLTGYTTNTSEAVEDALIAPNGTPYLASMAQQINNTNTELIALKTELKSEMAQYAEQQKLDNEQLTAAIGNIQTSGGGNGSSSAVPEGAVQIVVSYTPAHAAYFTLRYKLNGKDYIALPTTQEASISVFVDKNSNLGVQSTNGVTTKWVISADESFMNHEGDETYVNTAAGTNLTDLINIPIGQIDGGFTVAFASGTMTLSKAYRGLYNVSAKKVPSNGAFTVHFDANGGTGNADDITEVYYGSTITLPFGSFSRDGYAFAGWSEDSDAGMQEIDVHEGHDNIPLSYYGSQRQSKTVYDDIILYAVWTKKSVLCLASSDSGSQTNYIAINGKKIVSSWRSSQSAYVGIQKGDVISLPTSSYGDYSPISHTVTAAELSSPGIGSITHQTGNYNGGLTRNQCHLVKPERKRPPWILKSGRPLFIILKIHNETDWVRLLEDNNL